MESHDLKWSAFFYPTMVDALPAKGFGDGDDFC